MNSYNLQNKANTSNTLNTSKNNYAFIDAHNLYRSSLHWGWKLDYSKFLKFLQVKYSITTAYLFMGYRSENNEAYINLQKQGYILVFKDTTEKEEEIKGNSDVELVLQSLVEINQYDKAVIVTGDGDFGALVRYLNSVDKLETLLVPSDGFVPSILKRTAREKISFLNNLKSELASHSFHYNVPNNLSNVNEGRLDTRRVTNINPNRRNVFPNSSLNTSLNSNPNNNKKILEPDLKSPEIVDKKAQLLEAVKQAKLKSQEIIGTQKAIINNSNQNNQNNNINQSTQQIQQIKTEPIVKKTIEITQAKPELELKTETELKPKVFPTTLAISSTPLIKKNIPAPQILPAIEEDATKKIQNIVDDLMNAATLAGDDLDKTEKRVYKPRLKKKQQNSSEDVESNNLTNPSIHIE